MFPDVIGRDCVIPNVELLLEGYNPKLLRLILESNEMRKEEIERKRSRTKKSSRKLTVKRIAEDLQKELPRDSRIEDITLAEIFES